MNSEKLFELALGIQSPWYISNITFLEKDKRLDVYVDFNKGSSFSHKDAQGEFKVYDTVEKQWRHLNFFQHECYLHARVPRIKIDDNKIRQIETPWEGESNGFTLLFEALILQLLSYMPVHAVSKIIGVSDYKLWSMLEKYIFEARKLDDYSDVTVIGMDETSAKKRHEYITLFVDLNKRRTIFIADGKDKSTVKAFSEDFEVHKGVCQSITDVSCDMSNAFISGISENLPNAQITFDKFHIMKIINEALDNVRREESWNNPILRKSRYVFLKNRENLTVEEKNKYEEICLSKLNLKTTRAHRIREAFQDIYKADNLECFELMLKKWYNWAIRCKIKPMVKAAKTIKSHWDGIVRWKQSQINNGILEGLNSVIQAAKSKARGYSTLKNFKIIAYLITGKLNFNLVNKCYIPT